MTTIDPCEFFNEVTGPLIGQPGIARGTMMGFPCLRVDGAFFASCDRRTGDLIVKLPSERVVSIVVDGTGVEFAPNGRIFREWVTVENRDAAKWLDLIREALDFVRSG